MPITIIDPKKRKNKKKKKKKNFSYQKSTKFQRKMVPERKGKERKGKERKGSEL